MQSVSKPITPAFILREDKVSEFLENKKHGFNKAMERFEKHQPKKGVTTPFKSNV